MRSLQSLSSRTASTASAALLATAALALSAPAALADNGKEGTVSNDSGGVGFGFADGGNDGGSVPGVTSFGYTVTPDKVGPGGTVTLNTTGCEVPSVSVEAPVFDNVTLNEGHSATATVYPDAKPGAQYDVTFDCKGEKGVAKLTIADGGSSHHPGLADHKGVKAGSGAGLGAGDVTQLAAGAALVVGTLGAGVYFAVRRRGGSGGGRGSGGSSGSSGY
ncbi:hypothetical protein [Streptomyces sp. NPDC059009]|uniref:hypothetical protein n=1 Tax=Streptomyces sp. NPDC059009 TaxID=3346694 RepID=UPI00368D5953